MNIKDKAPDFTLIDDKGAPFSLSQAKSKIVLYFYPKDDTPGCTKEACYFRDNEKIFAKLKTEIIGISRDSQASHQKFKTKYDLPFRLLVDEKGEVCERFGVLKEKNLYGKKSIGIERSTFLIDEKGIIQAIWRKVKVDEHIQEILDFLGA